MVNDLTGKMVGVFEVLHNSGNRTIPGKNVLWTAKCPFCGNTKELTRQQMQRYQSCGCNSRNLLSQSLRKSLNRGGCGDIYATHWTTIRKNAISRELPFEIDVEFAWQLFLKQDRKCALTGVSLKFPSRCWSRDGTASMDRINSDLGYTPKNVQWVHKIVNMMKQQYPLAEFVTWCKRVVEHASI
jgi:hypothetical protein